MDETKMDEKLKWKSKIKWVNTTCSQLRVMCQCKHYFFTTKRFVSIETLHVHYMFPLAIETI
jgi:hypothetical protein